MNEIVLQGYLVKKRIQVSAAKAEEIRNLNISAQIHAAISSAILGGGSVQAVKDSVAKGFREGKDQVENLENGLEYKSEYFQHGDRESVERISEIESDPNFNGWIDPIAIDDIKKSIGSLGN